MIVDMPDYNTTIIWTHIYMSGMWLGVDLKTDTKKDMCLKEIG